MRVVIGSWGNTRVSLKEERRRRLRRHREKQEERTNQLRDRFHEEGKGEGEGEKANDKEVSAPVIWLVEVVVKVEFIARLP